MTAIAAIDALVTVLPLPDGVTIDDSVTAPAKTLPGRLYAWPRLLVPQKLEEANLRWPEADLQVRVLLALNAKGEPRVQKKERGVSVALDAWVDEVHSAMRVHRRHPLWWDAYIDNVSYDAVRTFDVRAVGLDITLRLNADAATPSGS